MNRESPVTFAAVVDGVLTYLRAKPDSWHSKFHLTCDVGKAIVPNYNGNWQGDQFQGQVDRALTKVVEAHPDEFIKVKRGDRYPSLDNDDQRYGSMRRVSDPMFTTQAHYRRCLDAVEAWTAERRSRDARHADLCARAKAAGVTVESSGDWTVELTMDDLEQVLTRLEGRR